MMTLCIVAIAVVALNLPFGYWRAGVRKFSVAWFAAVHLPIPVAVGLRLLSGLGWRWTTFPVLIGAYLTGQCLGGILRRRARREQLRRGMARQDGPSA